MQPVHYSQYQLQDDTLWVTPRKRSSDYCLESPYTKNLRLTKERAFRFFWQNEQNNIFSFALSSYNFLINPTIGDEVKEQFLLQISDSMFKQLVDDLAAYPERLQQIKRYIQNSPEITNRLEYLKGLLSPNLPPLEEDWHFNDLMSDLYKGPEESFILFAIGTGFGPIYPEACYQQMIPNYFKILASRYPNLKAKIFLIDPCFSKKVVRLLYPRLKEDGWRKKQGLANIIEFEKENMEIAFYRLEIPHKYSRHPEGSLLIKQIFKTYFSSYIAQALDQKSLVFIGRHEGGMGSFKVIDDVYNETKKSHPNKSNLQMYIACADVPPFSTPKIFGDWLNDRASTKRAHACLYKETMSRQDFTWETVRKLFDEIHPSFDLGRDLSLLRYRVVLEKTNQFNVLGYYDSRFP